MGSKSDVHVPLGSSDGQVLPKALTSPAETIPILFAIPIAGGAAGNTDLQVKEKVRVIDAWAVHTGGAGEASDTLQVFNGSNAITDAMDWSGADKAVVRAGEIDDAYHTIAEGGTLRVTTTDFDVGGDVGAGVVYVLGVRSK
jgi:hypothetical protein